jgi:uncharacterized repeat protein (TIGR01451 family)
MKRSIRVAATLVLCAAAATTALAQPARGEAQVHLNAYKVVVVRADGGTGERLQPLQAVQPGDTVEYEAVYRNDTGQPARNVAVTLPVPPGGLTYLPTAFLPKVASASRDGKLFEPLPLMHTEHLPDGRRELRPVPLSEYRYLRWQLGDLPSGTVRSVRARMHLPADAPRQTALN